MEGGAGEEGQPVLATEVSSRREGDGGVRVGYGEVAGATQRAPSRFSIARRRSEGRDRGTHESREEEDGRGRDDGVDEHHAGSGRVWGLRRRGAKAGGDMALWAWTPPFATRMRAQRTPPMLRGGGGEGHERGEEACGRGHARAWKCGCLRQPILM